MTTEGFYLCTLCAVDIATAWVELEPVWGKGPQRVRGSVQHVHARLPMPLRGLESDNGSEFINHAFGDRRCSLPAAPPLEGSPIERPRRSDQRRLDRRGGADQDRD